MAKIDFKGVMKNSADFIRKQTENLPDSVKNIDVNKTVRDLSEKGKSAIDSMKQKNQERNTEITNALQDSNKVRPMITAKGALQTIYIQMNIDGAISQEELKQFQIFAKDMDPEFDTYQNDMVSKLDELIAQTEKSDFYDDIHDEAGTIIRESINTPESAIDCKLLIWNMLVISYIDSEYNEYENKLVKYTAKQCGIDRSIVLEMESYILTQIAIEKEETALKQSGRQYAEVEKEITAINQRKSVMTQAIHTLISD